MNLPSAFARPTRPVVAGLFLTILASLALGWMVGTVAASSGRHAAAAPTMAPANAPGVELGAPYGGGQAATLPQPAGGNVTSGSGTSSIAYPLPGYGSLGVAPQGTILAQGAGTAAMKADGSDRAAALSKATDAALADAHASALVAAAAMGVGLNGIYSVSVTSNESYAYPTPDCVIAPLTPGLNQATSAGSGGATGSAVPVPVSPPAVCLQKGSAAAPTSAELIVTLVVAYKFA
jgi:hypothetical protein